MGPHPPDQTGQLFGAGVRIVHPAHHRVFKADPPAGGVLIAADRVHQLGHRVGVVDRHHLAADGVVGGMEGDGEGQLELSLGQPVDLGHDAAGGQADVPHPDVDPLGGGDQGEELHHLVEVIQRLADPHQDDVGNALPDVLLGGVDFRADLPRLQIADPARLGRGAEAAAHPAAHLGGDTDGGTVVIPHDHRLDAVAVGHPQQVLDGAVFGLLPALDGGRGDVEPFFQLCDQGLGLVGHSGKPGRQLLVHPVEDLFCPEGRLAHSFQLGGQLLHRQGRDAAFLFHSVLLGGVIRPAASHR